MDPANWLKCSVSAAMTSLVCFYGKIAVWQNQETEGLNPFDDMSGMLQVCACSLCRFDFGLKAQENVLEIVAGKTKIDGCQIKAIYRWYLDSLVKYSADQQLYFS